MKKNGVYLEVQLCHLRSVIRVLHTHDDIFHGGQGAAVGKSWVETARQVRSPDQQQQ